MQTIINAIETICIYKKKNLQFLTTGFYIFLKYLTALEWIKLLLTPTYESQYSLILIYIFYNILSCMILLYYNWNKGSGKWNACKGLVFPLLWIKRKLCSWAEMWNSWTCSFTSTKILPHFQTLFLNVLKTELLTRNPQIPAPRWNWKMTELGKTHKFN